MGKNFPVTGTIITVRRASVAITLLASALYSSVFALSFEGSMYAVKDGVQKDYFIWADLALPAGPGAVTGTYFYKKIGRAINLTGTSDGKTVSLTESDKKSNAVTGIFTLTLSSDSLYGTWNKPDGKDTLQVVLHLTDPAHRKFAVIPKPSALMLQHSYYEDNTLAGELAFFGAGIHYPDEEWVHFTTLFTDKNLLSVEVDWSNLSYTARYGTVHHTFDCATKQEINLWDEFSPALNEFFRKRLQEMVTTRRKTVPDADWEEDLAEVIGNSNGTIKNADDLFTVRSLPQRSELYLSNDSLIFWLEDFFEQNYDSGNRGATFDCRTGIPISEMVRYIKKGSLLSRRFGK